MEFGMEFVMELSWNCHGIVMEWSWNGHGIDMEQLWNSHGKVMEWTSPENNDETIPDIKVERPKTIRAPHRYLADGS